MSPVKPIHTLPSIVMPTGVRRVDREKQKREPDSGPPHEEEAGDEEAPQATAESSRDSDPETNPEDRGQIIDVKA